MTKDTPRRKLFKLTGSYLREQDAGFILRYITSGYHSQKPDLQPDAFIRKWYAEFGFHRFLPDRKPKQLSDGQQQKVALGRCITRDSAVFLMVEIRMGDNSMYAEPDPEHSPKPGQKIWVHATGFFVFDKKSGARQEPSASLIRRLSLPS